MQHLKIFVLCVDIDGAPNYKADTCERLTNVTANRITVGGSPKGREKFIKSLTQIIGSYCKAKAEETHIKLMKIILELLIDNSYFTQQTSEAFALKFGKIK